MSKYDLEQFYPRVQELWEINGCENAKQFCEWVSKQGEYLSQNTVSKWRKGGMPDLNSLTMLCNLFDVSIDYLLGKDECTTKAITDIHNATGLSEEAIKILNSQPCHITVVLSELISNGFLASPCETISECRSYIAHSKKPNIPNDFLDYMNTAFSINVDEFEFSEEMIYQQYLFGLTSLVFDASKSTFEKWKAYDYTDVSDHIFILAEIDILDYSKEHDEIIQDIRHVCKEIGYTFSDEKAELVATLLLSTFEYFADMKKAKLLQELMVPRRFNRFIDDYFDTVKQLSKDK